MVIDRWNNILMHLERKQQDFPSLIDFLSKDEDDDDDIAGFKVRYNGPSMIIIIILILDITVKCSLSILSPIILIPIILQFF